MSKSPDAVISQTGGISVIRAAIVTGKASVFVLGGYGAAELGGAALRMGLKQAEGFAAKGAWQATAVKAAPGLVATVIMTLMAFKGSMRGGRSRAEAAGNAAKVAVLMMIGVGASALREPIGKAMTSLQARLAGLLQPAASAGADNLGAGGNGDKLRLVRAGAEMGDSMFYNQSGTPQLTFAGQGETVPRAGGDAGFSQGEVVNTANIMRTESWGNGK